MECVGDGTLVVQNLRSKYKIGLLLEEDDDDLAAWDVYQLYGPVSLCELYSNEECAADGCLWRVNDMGSPSMCTTHFFGVGSSGYEFVELH